MLTDAEHHALRDITQRLDVTCGRCHRIIGDTDREDRTVDLCTYCKTQWKAELQREKNLLDTTMDTFHRLMDKEPVHPAFAVIKGGKHENQ